MRLTLLVISLSLVLAIPWLLFGDRVDAFLGGESGIAWMRERGHWAWAVAILLMIGDVIAPVPSTGVMTAMGILYGTLLGGLIGVAGSFAAGMVAFGAARLLGRRAAVFLCGERDLVKAEAFFRRGGGWAIAISRVLPLLGEVIACLAGLARMPPARFALALACGSVPFGFVFAAMGAHGVDRPSIAMGISLLIPLVFWPVARLLMRGREPEDRHSP